MIDWKGSCVLIRIYVVSYDNDGNMCENWIDEKEAFLDTDTMIDIFSKYDPQTHSYKIYPME